jgi:hypothetical protein
MTSIDNYNVPKTQFIYIQNFTLLCYTLYYIKFEIKEMSKSVVLIERSGTEFHISTKKHGHKSVYIVV